MAVKAPQTVPEALHPASGIAPDAVHGQMDRILASADFRATSAQKAFLRFVVEKTLSGQLHEIKGYSVATQVFGRRADFDQATDPIVSIQANKLRRALERYYLTAGSRDAIRIDVPKGTYVPRFERRSAVELPAGRAAHTTAGSQFETAWPRVLVRPLQNLSGDPDCDHWGIGLAMELAAELTRYPDIRVLAFQPGTHQQAGNPHGAHFEIAGGVHADGQSIKVTIHLTDMRAGVQIWSDTYRSARDAAGLISIHEEVARVVAVKAAGEFGLISRAMMRGLKKNPPKKYKAYEAILRFYEYLLEQTPQSFMRALGALSDAVRLDPECGQAWSMLGRLYANIHALDIPGHDAPLARAYEYARRGIALEAENQRSRGTLAYVCLFRGEIEEGLAEVEKAIALNPNCLFVLDGLGYLMTLMGAWERGTDMIREVIRINPFYSTTVHYALWLDWLRRGNDKKAYLETLNLNDPNIFWEPLSQAASLGHLGRIAEGRQAAARLLSLKPDFSRRGRMLIGHFVKFDDIAERIIEGLRQSGIDVE